MQLICSFLNYLIITYNLSYTTIFQTHTHTHTYRPLMQMISRALITWQLVSSPTVSVLTLNPWSRIILHSNPNLVFPTHLLSQSPCACCGLADCRTSIFHLNVVLNVILSANKWDMGALSAAQLFCTQLASNFCQGGYIQLKTNRHLIPDVYLFLGGKYFYLLDKICY